MRNDDSELVYSTDSSLNLKAQKNRKKKSPTLSNQVDLEDFSAVMRIEKSGRSGKVVTVIDGLPNVESYLETLSRELKSSCGSGGTYLLGQDGQGKIEIQGDKRDVLRRLLEKKKIKVKG